MVDEGGEGPRGFFLRGFLFAFQGLWWSWRRTGAVRGRRICFPARGFHRGVCFLLLRLWVCLCCWWRMRASFLAGVSGRVSAVLHILQGLWEGLAPRSSWGKEPARKCDKPSAQRAGGAVQRGSTAHSASKLRAAPGPRSLTSLFQKLDAARPPPNAGVVLSDGLRVGSTVLVDKPLALVGTAEKVGHA